MKTSTEEDLLKNIEELKIELDNHNSNLSLAILTLFSYTADCVNRYLDKNMIKHVSVNRTAYQILLALAASDGDMIQKDLSDGISRSRYTITRIIDSLERRGLVRRSSDKNDRRVNKILLTPKGVAVIKNSIDGRLKMSQAAVECLDMNEQKELRVLLRKLWKHLDALNKRNNKKSKSKSLQYSQGNKPNNRIQ